MNFDDARQLLARMVTLDPRFSVDTGVISLWAEALDGFTLDECLWALRAFVTANERDYPRPAHLIRIVREKRREWAWSHPGHTLTAPDAWLTFEAQIRRARIEIERVQLRGLRYAVDVMNDDDGQDVS